ncbi:MAG: protein-glutamate O-methyltransferase CheR [Syntrophobacteraceae bacterium]
MNMETVTLSDRDFSRLSEFIHVQCGIKMPPGKRTMLEGRLRKRLRALGMESFGAYCEHLLSPDGMSSECVHMIDVVTTNKTDFFREPGHFEYLVQVVLPELVDRGIGTGNRLNAWSAACSTGEEAYTIAMVLNEYSDRECPIDFSILATDISTQVLDKARCAIYDHERVEPVPMYIRRKYMLRSKDKTKDLIRIDQEIRKKVRFQRLNFMDDNYKINEKMAFIFCRNVLIYFDKDTQQSVLAKLCKYLMPGGYLFTGHSETIQGLDLPVINVGTTVYRKI